MDVISSFALNKLIKKLERKICCLENQISELGSTVLLSVTDSETYTLLAGEVLEKITLDVNGTGTFMVGTTPGGSEIAADSVTSGQALLWVLNFYDNTAQTIYFTGDADIKLFIR